MKRFQESDKSDWLSRKEMWYGIVSAGSIKNVYVNTLDFIKLIRPTFAFVDADPTRSTRNAMLDLSVKGANFMFNEDGASEMCPKNTRGSMQKSRMVVKF